MQVTHLPLPSVRCPLVLMYVRGCVCLCSYQLYPDACDGIFFDEAPYLLGTLLDLYQTHNTFAHATLDNAEVLFLRLMVFMVRGE